MFARLALLFVTVPLLELALLVEVGGRLGVLPTVALVVGTGIAGAALARSQGLRAWRRLREELAAGVMPPEPLADAALLLVAAAVLLTPGLLTDALGFFLLVPAGRRAARRGLGRWFRRRLLDGSVRVATTGPGAGARWVREPRPAGSSAGRDPAPGARRTGAGARPGRGGTVSEDRPRRSREPRPVVIDVEPVQRPRQGEDAS